MSEVSARSILLRLGISDFNATQIIPYLFTSSMTTDPKSPMIILLVRAIQQKLNMMGAGLVETGYLDMPTAAALTQLSGGRGWARWAWSDIVQLVLAQQQSGVDLTPVTTMHSIAATGDVTTSFMPFGLPDVPGGAITYIAGGLLALHFLRKKKG